MNINLKKGKTSDISIVLGKHFSENTQSYGKIFEMLVANDFSYSFSDKLEDEYSIQLHLNTLTKADESKAKKASEAITSKKKEKENFDINLLLSKYSFQPQKSTQMPKTKPKTQLTGDYKLKLYLLYVNSSNLQELMTHFERLKTSHKPEVKYIFLLEGIQDFVSGKEMKNKKQKKDFMLSQQMGSQIQLKFGNDGRMCIEEENLPFESREELEEFLVELSLESQLDYKLTSNANETLEFLKSCIGSVIQSKHKSNLGYFDVKSHSHTEVSIYSGFQDFYSLAWIELLMNAPGVSEDKAIAIVKQYPTMKSLMEEFEKTGNKKALEDVKVVHKYDESKPKRLGPAASIKISKLLTSDNPSDIV